MNFVQVMLVGVVATACMTLSLYSIHWSGFANGDMVRALGSWVTRRYEDSLPIGLLIHFSAGAGFALIYVLAWQWTGFPATTLGVPIGALFGLFHGSVVSLMLVMMVAEHHPLERFREAGFRVALTHVVAHVVYGVVIGGAISTWDLHL